MSRIGPEELTARFQKAMSTAREHAKAGSATDAAFVKGLEFGYEIFANYRDEERRVVDLTPPAAEP